MRKGTLPRSSHPLDERDWPNRERMRSRNERRVVRIKCKADGRWRDLDHGDSDEFKEEKRTTLQGPNFVFGSVRARTTVFLRKRSDSRIACSDHTLLPHLLANVVFKNGPSQQQEPARKSPWCLVP